MKDGDSGVFFLINGFVERCLFSTRCIGWFL